MGWNQRGWNKGSGATEQRENIWQESRLKVTTYVTVTHEEVVVLDVKQ